MASYTLFYDLGGFLVTKNIDTADIDAAKTTIKNLITGFVMEDLPPATLAAITDPASLEKTANYNKMVVLSKQIDDSFGEPL